MMMQGHADSKFPFSPEVVDDLCRSCSVMQLANDFASTTKSYSVINGTDLPSEVLIVNEC